MIIGGHIMIQSTQEGADKAFFRDVLKLPTVDAGGGFLIFGIPPSDVAVHAADKDGGHELFLMCDDVEKFLADMTKRGVQTAPVQRQMWGIVTAVTLPGGGKLSVYQPLHKRPKPAGAKRAAPKKKAKTASAKKPAKKKAKRKGKKAKGR